MRKFHFLTFLFIFLAAFAEATATRTVRVSRVSTYREYSEVPSTRPTRIFVLHFDQAIRNRSGYVIPVNNAQQRIPVLFTVGTANNVTTAQPIAYDAGTTQLEVRESELNRIDLPGLEQTTQGRQAFISSLVRQDVLLELELGPAEFNPVVTTLHSSDWVDPAVTNPLRQIHYLQLGIDHSLPVRTNGSVRATIVTGNELRYVSFFLYPPPSGVHTNRIHLDRTRPDLNLTPDQLGRALVGRKLGLETSVRPWRFIPNPKL